MSTERCFDSALERIVADCFKTLGIELGSFPEAIPGRPDFVIRGHQIAVFVHGCYWHRHHKCQPQRREGLINASRSQKFSRTVVRDNEVRRKLRMSGWSVVILWECTLRANPHEVVNELKNHLSRNKHSELNNESWLYVA